MNLRSLPVDLSVLFVLASLFVVGGCTAETERPPAESTTAPELVSPAPPTVAVSTDETQLAPAAAACVPLQTRACKIYWMAQVGSVSVQNCLTSSQRCQSDGITWSECGAADATPS